MKYLSILAFLLPLLIQANSFGYQSFRSVSLNLSSPNSTNDNSNKLYFQSSANEGQDGFDGSKLGSLEGSPTIAFVQNFGSGKVFLTQDARALNPDTIQTYELELEDDGITGNFTLGWNSFTNIPSLWEFELTDLALDSTIDMRSVSSYSFGLPASVDTVRFKIRVDPISSVREISGDAGWRLVSIPKDAASVSDISDDTAIQGVTGGSDTGSDANVYTYDDTGAYEVPTNVSTTISNGYGLAVYFYNNTINGSSTLPLSLDVSGIEPSVAVATNLYSGATGRYTLLGNPYSTNYNLTNSTANGAIGNNISFWDNSVGSFVTQSSTDGGGFIVSPFQGFFVVTGSSSTSTYTFNTAGRTTSAISGSYLKESDNNTNADVEFSILSSYNIDKNLKIQVRNEAVQGWDNWDLPKLNSLLYYNVSGAFEGILEGEGIAKAIESVPLSLTDEITIPLTINLIGETQEVTMSWKGVSDIPDSWDIILEDYELGTSINLREAGEYSFIQVAAGASQKAKSLLNSGLGETMKLKSTNTNRFGITITPNTAVSNEDELTTVDEFRLEQNYPNPFNPSTTIKYAVAANGPVNITIYNITGQKVAELLNTTKNAGTYQVTWNATAQASGIYYYRLTAPGQVLTRQMTLIK